MRNQDLKVIGKTTARRALQGCRILGNESHIAAMQARLCQKLPEGSVSAERWKWVTPDTRLTGVSAHEEPLGGGLNSILGELMSPPLTGVAIV